MPKKTTTDTSREERANELLDAVYAHSTTRWRRVTFETLLRRAIREAVRAQVITKKEKRK